MGKIKIDGENVKGLTINNEKVTEIHIDGELLTINEPKNKYTDVLFQHNFRVEVNPEGKKTFTERTPQPIIKIDGTSYDDILLDKNSSYELTLKGCGYWVTKYNETVNHENDADYSPLDLGTLTNAEVYTNKNNERFIKGDFKQNNAFFNTTVFEGDNKGGNWMRVTCDMLSMYQTNIITPYPEHVQDGITTILNKMIWRVDITKN